jgi:hypothetical protein
MSSGMQGGISLSKINKLNLKSDWRQWIRDIIAWLIQNRWNSLEPVAPEGIRTQAQTEAFNTLHSKWLLDQEIAINGIKFACGNRAFKFAEAFPLPGDRIKLLAKLEKEFKPTGDSRFSALNNEYEELNLGDFSGVEEYAIAFSDKITELQEIGVDVTVNNATCIKKFISGLGDAFNSWEQSFNQQHQYLGDNAVSLEVAQEGAITESIRMRRDNKGPDKFALLSSQVAALIAQNAELKNANGKRPGGPGGRKDRPSPCSTCCKDPALPKYHAESGCWMNHPQLYVDWATANPGKDRARSTRLLAEGKTDPMVAKVARLQSLAVSARMAHEGGMPIRGGAEQLLGVTFGIPGAEL